MIKWIIVQIINQINVMIWNVIQMIQIIVDNPQKKKPNSETAEKVVKIKTDI